IQMGPDGAKLDAHQRAHMFQIRLEREYAHFAALTACDLPFHGMPKRYEVFLFNDYSEHHAFCERFIGLSNDKQGKQHHEMQKDQPDLMIFTTCESIVRRGKDVPFANWCERLQPGELGGLENGFTWGIVKWLIDTEPVRFTKMIDKMDDLKLT